MAGIMIFSIIYLSAEMILVWNAAVHKNWQHYVRKERERSELMAIVTQSRDEGILEETEDKMQ